jgi:hypothetical protein
LVDDFLSESSLVHSRNGVGQVTSAANREFFIRLGHDRAMDALLELLINALMALGAGFSNLTRVNL